MRHLKSGWKLKRTSSHRKALLRNLATQLLEHKRIETTLAKAKALRPFVEKLITKAKRAILRERQNLLPEGHKIDIHARRIVGRLITNKAVLQELFDTIAPVVVERPGGYLRIVKTGFRRGDAAEMAVVELVDWGAPQDGAVSKRTKAKSKSRSKARSQSKTQKAPKKAVEETTKELEPLTVEEVKEPTAAETAVAEQSVEAEATTTQSVTDLEEETSGVGPTEVGSDDSNSNATDETTEEKQ
jgi:large subunit ribosomal protein L17